MSRILTGIQSSGVPHLGNILGAIQPGIALSQDPANEALFFIADFHSMTTLKDGGLIRENTYATAAAWLAFGFDADKNVFYRQSDIPQVCELLWYLSCTTPFPMLANAHSFKDKSDRLSDVNTGLFTYPVLMAGDILLYDAEIVPVGKDQMQHLEMARDMAGAFNHIHGETFVIPEGRYDKKVMVIPGTDGQKMSKSYGNFINLFQPDKKLRKQVMTIVTDSKGLDDVKDPDTCNAFKLYELLANADQIAEMRENYLKGGYGYGHAKQALFELLVEQFGEAREKFDVLMSNKSLIDEQLAAGAEKAQAIALPVLDRVRGKLGFGG